MFKTLVGLALLNQVQIAFATEIQFEGYYRLESDSQPIGYVIQRYEIDEKAKIMRSAYFLKTNELGGDIQESLKAEAKTNNKSEFDPISFQYTGQTGKTIKTIDGVFRKERMEITRGDGKKQKKELYKIPADTFLSTFLNYMMLQKGLKTGKKYIYSAVAEEEGNSYKGEAEIKGEEKYQGITVYKIDSRFKGDHFISFMTPKGETIGTVVPEKNLKLVLVAKPSDATTGFPVPNKIIVATFGNMPDGKLNVLSRKPASSED